MATPAKRSSKPGALAGAREPWFMAGAFTLVAGCGSSFSSAPHDGGAAETGTDSGHHEGDAGGGSPDASPSDAPGQGAGWCGSRKDTFCEDFDEPEEKGDITTFLSTWTSYVQAGGSFSFDTSSKPSAPNALRAAGASKAQVLVVKTFPALGSRPSRLRLEFDLRINAIGTVKLASAAGIAAIAYGGGVDDGYVALALGNDLGPTRLSAVWALATDAGAADAGPFGGQSATSPLPALGVWAGRYAIEIDLTTPSPCLQIYGGPTKLLDPCVKLPPSFADPKVVSIALGEYAGGFGDTGTIDVEFDDVTYDATP